MNDTWLDRWKLRILSDPALIFYLSVTYFHPCNDLKASHGWLACVELLQYKHKNLSWLATRRDRKQRQPLSRIVCSNLLPWHFFKGYCLHLHVLTLSTYVLHSVLRISKGQLSTLNVPISTFPYLSLPQNSELKMSPTISEVLLRRSLEISPMPSPSLSTSHTIMPTSIPSSTPVLPARPPSPERRASQPLDSGAFLTALAAQERRVLELREELQKAESDLEKLKKHWAVHEMFKKKNQIRHLEQLRPLSKPVSSSNSANPNSLGRTRPDHERRRSLAINTKQSQRKVFSGSRHTRTLSLLSPKGSADLKPDSTVKVMGKSSNRIARSDTAFAFESRPTTTIIRASNNTVLDKTISGPPKDAILETGKQLVGDFREGLWTFLEDLRQATVGEEATSNSDSRATTTARSVHITKDQQYSPTVFSPGGSPSVSDTQKFNGSGLGTASGNGQIRNDSVSPDAQSSTPSVSSAGRKPAPLQLRQSNVNAFESDDDGWDNWDSPKPPKYASARRSTSTSASSDRESSEKSSPRTSVR